MPFVSLACCFLVPYIETWWHWPIFHEVWISYQFPALSLLETCQIFDIPALCSSMPTQWHMFLPPCLDLLAPSFMSWFKVYRNQEICISHHISIKSIVSCFRHFQTNTVGKWIAGQAQVCAGLRSGMCSPDCIVVSCCLIPNHVARLCFSTGRQTR